MPETLAGLENSGLLLKFMFIDLWLVDTIAL